MFRRVLVFIVLALLTSSCAGSISPESRRAIKTRVPETQRDDGIRIEGQLGTIAPAAVESTFASNMSKFQRCLTRRWEQVDIVSGDIEFYTRLREDGVVRWAVSSYSTLGDYLLQQCLIDALKQLTFPRPVGGEAEFRYGLSFDLPEDIRPPEKMSQPMVDQKVATRFTEGCASLLPVPVSSFTLTAYIGSDGHVIAAGVAPQQLQAVAAAECALDQLRSIRFRTPGSYPGKIQVNLMF